MDIRYYKTFFRQRVKPVSMLGALLFALLMASISAVAGNQKPVSKPVTLIGHQYDLYLISPSQLDDLKLVDMNAVKVRDTKNPYLDHVNPIYNIHCELALDKTTNDLKKELEKKGISWPAYWADLASKKLKDTEFAIVAFHEGKLAGYIRFFPASLAQLRWLPKSDQEDKNDRLLIGAACVDMDGLKDGLHRELIRETISHAKKQGYSSIWAVGWSDVPIYAIWAESFPGSAYKLTGFNKTFNIVSDTKAFDDMLAGRHGKVVQDLAKEGLGQIPSQSHANRLYLVEYNIPDSERSFKRPEKLEAPKPVVPKQEKKASVKKDLKKVKNAAPAKVNKKIEKPAEKKIPAPQPAAKKAEPKPAAKKAEPKVLKKEPENKPAAKTVKQENPSAKAVEKKGNKPNENKPATEVKAPSKVEKTTPKPAEKTIPVDTKKVPEKTDEKVKSTPIKSAPATPKTTIAKPVANPVNKKTEADAKKADKKEDKVKAETASKPKTAPVKIASPANPPQLPKEIKKKVEPAKKIVVPNSKIWIKDVPSQLIGNSWDAPVKGLQLILEFHGSKASENELLAISGDAFNLCHASHWQGTAFLCIPTNPIKNILDAFGFQYQFINDGSVEERHGMLAEPLRQELTKKVIDEIKKQIDKKQPVLACGFTKQADAWDVISGYDKANNEFLVIGQSKAPMWQVSRGFPGNPNYQKDKGGFWDGAVRGSLRAKFAGGWLINPVFFIGPKIKVPPKTDVIRTTLKRAVDLFNASKISVNYWGGVDYYFGKEAYQLWAEDLDLLNYPTDLNKRFPYGAEDWYHLLNMGVQLDQIVKGRTAAADYCEQACKSFPKAAADLNKAVENYRNEVKLVNDSFSEFIPFSTDKKRAYELWLSNRKNCEVGAKVIKQMLKEETAAIKNIEKALEKMK